MQVVTDKITNPLPLPVRTELLSRCGDGFYEVVMKFCYKCDIDKPVEEFSNNKSTKDGLQSECKACVKVYRKKNRERDCLNKKLWNEANKNHVANQRKLYLELNREQISKRKTQWRKDNESAIKQYRMNRREIAKISLFKWKKTNGHKIRAHSAFNRALKMGHIEKSPCYICDDPKSQGHHEDYSKPLEVVWLCALHHKRRHMEIEEEVK